MQQDSGPLSSGALCWGPSRIQQMHFWAAWHQTLEALPGQYLASIQVSGAS